MSPGQRFRLLLPNLLKFNDFKTESNPDSNRKAPEKALSDKTSSVSQATPLVIVGAINTFTALLAEKAGHQALYLSGAGVANASFGLPDLAITHLGDVVEDALRITYRSELPLLVDMDTGWGSYFSIQRSIKTLERAGVAAIHIEDQANVKRCGHRPNKTIVSAEEMVDRIKAAVDARQDEQFFIMARTDAYAQEGLEKSIERALLYIEAGADGIFAEALSSLQDYQAFYEHLKAPILANITEFGKTPLFTKQELFSSGVSMVLYPLTAFRAMAKTADRVYKHLASESSQKPILEQLQTRESLYEILDYYQFEAQLDQYQKKIE